MRPFVLLDTSAWFAALNVRDPRHQAALESYEQDLVRPAARLVTTNLVVAELHALLARRQGSAAGLSYLDHLYADPAIEAVVVTRELEREAVDRWLRPFGDHRFSLTDAVSFELMRKEGVKLAFAYDQHFATAGYRLLPGGR